MDFDLSGLPEELQGFIRTALQGRRKALLTAETEIKAALQDSINRIRERIGKRGVFTGITQELAERIAEEKVFFASELERITQEGLTRAAYAGLFVGEQLKQYYKEKGLLKFRLIEKDALREAEIIAESTMRKQRIFKHKEFVLSDRIWDISHNNYDKIQEIISSGINTDCAEVARALQQYVKEGAKTFAENYPNMYDRMGGRVPKNLNYEALRLARNELSEVYWQATIEGFKENPAVRAVKWLLSNNRLAGYHDICDTMAYSNNHGLGAGVYPVDEAPEKPHICCLCSLAPVIAKDIERGNVANKPPENWEAIRTRLENTSAFTNLEELTEAQKEKLKEQRHAAYIVRLEKKLETLHNEPAKYRKAYATCYGTTVNKHKQNRHIFGSKTVKADGSYFKNDLETLQTIIDEKAGKGVISLTKRNLIEIIQDDRLKGFDIDPKTSEARETCKAKIHYSKTGIHLVPYTSREKEKK
ncbi:MAG: polymorphic toxin type 50 domain-containing protein [Treponema sp.]|uniref:polymorphic toxin type 50 domain-containing protein n=1 Tax=Treponema sp. TaxID=166 RepID=UPI003FA2C90D